MAHYWHLNFILFKNKNKFKILQWPIAAIDHDASGVRNHAKFQDGHGKSAKCQLER